MAAVNDASAENKAEKLEEEDDYIKTTTHNYISRNAKIEGARNVELKGRSIVQERVTLRGDLAVIRIGRYCFIQPQSTLQPSTLLLCSSNSDGSSGGEQYIKMTIGNHTLIGSNCTIEAAAIGSMVMIGDSVKIGKRCIIKDCCIIDPNVVLGDDTVIPPFTRISSSLPEFHHPQATLPPSISVELQELTMESYQDFVSRQQEKAIRRK